MSSLEQLPAEILSQVFSYLSPISLARLSQTSKSLQSHAEDDRHWARLVKENVPNPAGELWPSPCKTWKKLYVSQHPYWFIPRHKIWFADRLCNSNVVSGSILIGLYNPLSACIEGYRLVAKASRYNPEIWEWNPDAVLYTFEPTVKLCLHDPVIKLDPMTEAPQIVTHLRTL